MAAPPPGPPRGGPPPGRQRIASPPRGLPPPGLPPPSGPPAPSAGPPVARPPAGPPPAAGPPAPAGPPRAGPPAGAPPPAAAAVSAPPPAAQQPQHVEPEADQVLVSVDHAADYLLRTEKDYVMDGLRTCVEHFYNPLKAHCRLSQEEDSRVKEVIADEDINAVFLNFKNIYEFNLGLYEDLLEYRMLGPEYLLERIGEIFSNYIPFFKQYASYIQGFRDAIMKFKKLRETSSKLQEFLEIAESSECAALKLEEFLKLPAQRMPQYMQLLGSVYDLHPDKNSLGAMLLFNSIIDLQAVTDDITEKVREMNARQLVYRLQEDVFSGNVSLVTNVRKVVNHANLKVVPRKKRLGPGPKRYLFVLMNDILLWGTRPKSLFSGKVAGALPLTNMRVVEVPKTKEYPLENQFQVLPGTSTEDSFIVAAPTPADLKKWIDAIRQAVLEHNHTLHPVNPTDLLLRVKKSNKVAPEGMLDYVTQTDPAVLDQIRQYNEAKHAETAKRTRLRKIDLTPYGISSGPQQIVRQNSAPNVGRVQQHQQAAAPPPGLPPPGGAPGMVPPSGAPPPLSRAFSQGPPSAAPGGAAPGRQRLPSNQQHRMSPPPGSLPPPGGPPGPGRQRIAQAPMGGPPRGPPGPPRGPPGAPPIGAPPIAAAPPMGAPRGPPAGGGGLSGGLLSSIRSGTSLKKVEPGSGVPGAGPSTGAGRGGLLSSIRSGVALKKAAPRAAAGPAPGGQSGGMASILSASLANYRQFVKMDDVADEFGADDDEWDD